MLEMSLGENRPRDRQKTSTERAPPQLVSMWVRGAGTTATSPSIRGGDPLGVLTRLGGGAVPVEVFCPQSVAPRHPIRMRAVSPLSRNSKHKGAHSGAVVTAAWLPGGPASIRSDTGP